jgi:hypothetical protein
VATLASLDVIEDFAILHGDASQRDAEDVFMGLVGDCAKIQPSQLFAMTPRP